MAAPPPASLRPTPMSLHVGEGKPPTSPIPTPASDRAPTVSIHAVLGLLAAGSQGATLDQLLSVLRAGAAADLNQLSSQVVSLVLADGSASGGPKLCFSNGVWVDASMSLKEAFKAIANKDYKAEAKAVDFQSKADEVTSEVNSWVEKVTAGLIKELLPAGSVNQNTRLVLGNALYYKGAWENKFDASKTKESEFHLLNGSSVQAPFMSTKEKQFISAYDGFKVLKLPYKQGEDKRQFSMYIFLPDARDGLWNLQEKLSSESGFLDHHCPRQKVAVGTFKLPRFKISFGFEASEVLKGLGLILPFTGGGLTELVDSPVGGNLYVSSVFHKSVVEVNEEGTEAAAGTAAVLLLRSLPMDPLDFEADHPFVFVIREDTTGVVLFTGHLLNPSITE